ncbi:hypothetical protein [Flavobacterium sp.]|uniref:hypothetical protein n=1 Tax=Flavobacterium sp. TaxID=239 RepID=UPI00121ED87B|nr:hypothetical protein [Flavobacterium sp.]RZJ73295.1 MAG: hypothetical protein EOO49_03020 [Flavobacterium sp.]
MKGKTVILLLLAGMLAVVGAAFLKIQHVGNAELFLLLALVFQVGIFGYIIYRNFSKGGKS